MPSAHGLIHILDSSSGKSRPLTLANNVLAVDGSSATQPISVASLPLPALAATDSSVQAVTSALSSLATEATATSSDSKLGSIASALSGTLTTTAAVSKSATTVNSSSIVGSSDYSASHDASTQRRIAIFGTTNDNSNNIDIYVSQDDSTYYKLGVFSMFPQSGSFSLLLDAPFKYVKLRYNGAATVTAIIAGSN